MSGATNLQGAMKELQLFDPTDFLLTPMELAKRWSVHVVTLANWRVKGKGPKYVKAGRQVRYPMSRVKEYELQQTFTNTAFH